jgi:hypothetical protein
MRTNLYCAFDCRTIQMISRSSRKPCSDTLEGQFEEGLQVLELIRRERSSRNSLPSYLFNLAKLS